MKHYLLVYDPALLDDWVVPNFLAETQGVFEGYSFFGNAFCIRTDASIAHVSEVITNRFPGLQFFLVQLEKAPRAGQMPKAFWQFLKESSLQASVA